ncbi:alpha-(1-_3)-arabinofuranosyltransferase [Frankia sp. R82]|uniref:alpha-(1->3)-arabinofuranosyltransferase n=1 Tax=Frankia sp. R82 TaxID=2950553 RepID=UPI002043E692|nr:alpha-(1->3)-arabinofuranosyltransferase [Frankia sp. R82]MCM3885637.1 alpha-(1->3)-arabinofuranosyltransferase [Frankia sp. R82]
MESKIRSSVVSPTETTSGPHTRESVAPPRDEHTSRWPLLGIAVGFSVLYLLQAPGKLTADTKLDVPLDPWGFMGRATHLWNSLAEFGYLPNQYVGYLFPMGPFFGLGHLLGVPPWISQRLWMALLLTVAAWGMVRLADALRLGVPVTRVVAGLVYTLSPMFLGKIGATSVALVGATMLPWIMLPLILALRPDGALGADTGTGDAGPRAVDAGTIGAGSGGEGGERRLAPRRAAALSGLAVLCTGGINATVTLCVLVCPAVVLLFAGGSRRAWALRAWWVLAVLLATAWWVLALAVQGRYGLNFLPYTETATTTTATTSVAEALRGATDWLAYLQLPRPWLPAATEYVSRPVPILGSAAVVAIGLWGLARPDLPARRLLLVTLAVGTVSVSAAYPGDPGGPLAGALRDLLGNQLGFLRNVYKFQPVVRLPIALGVAHALTVLPRRSRPRRVVSGGPAPGAPAASGPAPGVPSRWRPRWQYRGVASVTAVLTAAALVCGMTPALSGRALQPRPFTQVPDYWVQAAGWLADHPDNGRTLVLPASPFAEYSWGRPLDEPLQWLAKSPWGVRSLIPLGGVGVTRLMDGIEQELATGSAPGLGTALARAGVGQILLRNDLEQKNWDVPPSTDELHRALESSGLTRAASFGPQVPARASAKERLVPKLRNPSTKVPALEVWTVPGGASMVRSYPADSAVVVSGGPEATVQLAAQGLLGPDRAVVLAGDLAAPANPTPPSTSPAAIKVAPSQVIAPGTAWFDTDTLTRRDSIYGIVHDASSYLLGPTGNAVGRSGVPNQWAEDDVDGHQTVAGYADGMSVTASSYGYDLFAAPDLAPQAAVDGYPGTSWTVMRTAGSSTRGQWIQLDVGRRISVPYLDLQLLSEGSWRPRVRAMRVTTETGSIVTEVSPVEAVQRLAVPPGQSRWYRVTFERVDPEGPNTLGGGIRELTVPGVTLTHYAQLPDDVSSLFAGTDRGHIAYSLVRERVDPAQPFGGSEELTLARRFEVPTRMDVIVAGSATFLPPPRGTPAADDGPLLVDCGSGPTLVVDGRRYPLRITGRNSDVTAVRPVQVSLCTDDSRLTLTPGQHLVTVDQGTTSILVDSLSIVGPGQEADPTAPRTTTVDHWGAERRTVRISAGSRAFLSVRENANTSWTAKLNGVVLTPLRLDGWQQGWIVPAGAGGTVVISNAPGEEYRRNLFIGLGLVLVLLALAVAPPRLGRRRGRPDRLDTALMPWLARLPGVPRPAVVGPAAGQTTGPRLPVRLVWAGLATLAVLLVAGPVALAVPIVILIGRRWPTVPAWIAAAGMAGAGVAVAVAPNSSPGSGQGAFGAPTQLLGAVAFAAVLAALVAWCWDRPVSARPRPAPAGPDHRASDPPGPERRGPMPPGFAGSDLHEADRAASDHSASSVSAPPSA